MATGPWDPGSARFLASDADRERTVDVLKTAFVHGTLTRDELTLRTGRALTARTYAELAAITDGLTPGTPRPAPGPAMQTPRRRVSKRRVSKKVVALSACAVVRAAYPGRRIPQLLRRVPGHDAVHLHRRGVVVQAASPASAASGKINRWQALTSKS